MKYPIVCIKNTDRHGMSDYPVCKNTMYYTSISRLDYDWLEVIHVTDNEGKYIGLYNKKLFITLAEWRDEQINKILYEE